MNAVSDAIAQPAGNQPNSAASVNIPGKNSPFAAFQSLLKGQLAKESGAESAVKDLKDILAGLNADQLAEIMSLLGLLINQPVGQFNQSIGQNFAVESPGAFRAAGNPVFGGGEQQRSNLLSQLADQLQKMLAPLLQQANVSIEQVMNQVKKKASIEGLSAQEAFLDVVRSAVKNGKSDIARALGELPVLFVPDKAARKPDPLTLKQAAQIRPEIQAVQPATLDSAKPAASGQAQATTSNTTIAQQSGNVQQNMQPAMQEAKDEEASSNLWIPNSPLAGVARTDSGRTAQPVEIKLTSDQFKSEFQGILVKNASLIDRGGASEMKISLMPDGLGEIRVHVVEQSGQVALQISADTPYAKSLIDAGIAGLRQQLEAQGLQVNRVEVMSSPSSDSLNNQQGMFEGQKDQHQQREGNRQNASTNNYTDSLARFDTEIQNLESQEAVSELFNATA